MPDRIWGGNTKRNFILISSVLFAVMFFLEKINGRFWLNDFKVFYLAAKALINNEQVYGIAFGLPTGFYKYSPFTLLLFAPFTILPFNAASVIDFIINAFCSIATIIILVKIVGQYLIIHGKLNLQVLLVLLFCVIIHLVRELHLGNTNMILLFLLCLSLKFILESKPIKSGAVLAVVILTKPYFLICLLPFLLYKKFKAILSFSVSLLIFVLSSFIVSGFSRGMTLYSGWFTAMKEHSTYLSSAQTIPALLNYYFGISVPPDYGIFLLGIISLILYSYFLINDRHELNKNINDHSINKSLIIYFSLLISIVPSILITDTEHFLFSLPLITILLLLLARERNYFWIILFTILIFLYDGNSSDLLGKNLAAKFETHGLLGISNLILIGSVIFLYSKHNKFMSLKEKK